MNHLFSFRFNRRRDQTKKPNIGAVMFWPYARILPIHLTIILGTGVMDGSHALILFLGLKTAADLVMHAIQHAAPEAMN